MELKFFLLFLFLNYFDNSEGSKSVTPSSPPPSTTPSSQDSYLDGISIQDVLSSDIDASEKIEKKIINAVTEYASNCQAYKKIDLSTDGFVFPENSVTIDLGSENVIFNNIRISESSPSSYRRKSYSTLIGCDSTKKVKIEVKLPKDLEISADIKVDKIANSSSRFKSGSMTLTLKNNSILKQFSTQTDDSSSSTSKIFYTKSAVSLDIATEFQMQIYNKLEEFFDKVESSLRQFLIGKLDEELLKNGISVADNCSKFINADKSSKKVNLPFLNNNLNNLYVIPNSKLETWKGVSLSAGPIVLEGLSSFNNSELTVLQNEFSSPDGEGFYYRTTPSYNDPEKKEMTVKVKTNDLKGKLDWSYNSKERSIPFTIEFIQFEVKKSNTFEYTRKSDEYSYDSSGRQRYYPYNSYARSNTNKITVNLNLGDIQIKSSKSSVCENESEFVNFVLSEYLKTVIADSLKNSLDKKIQNEPIFASCD